MISIMALIVMMLFALPGKSLAQSDYDKNVVKLQLTPLAINTFGVQYERMLSKKISIAVTGRYTTKLSDMILDRIESSIDDPTSIRDLRSLDLKGSAITPEIRFYMGRHDGPRGFYVAPYVSYSNYDLGLPNFQIKMEEQAPDGSTVELTKLIDLDGKVKGFSGGLLLGAQWRFGKSVYLDWWFLGASYGTASGELNASVNETLDQEWQDAIKERLENLDVPLIKIEPTVHAHGVDSKISGPWAGIRSGLSIGIKF